jgi:hypothetical protein
MQPTTPKSPQPNRRLVAFISGAVVALLVIAAFTVFTLHASPLKGKLVGRSMSSSATPTAVATLDPRPHVTPSANKTPLIQMSSYQNFAAGTNSSGPVTPQNPTSIFLINRFVYIIGNTNDQTKAGDTIRIKWYFNDVDATPSIQKTAPKCCDYVLTPDKAGKQVQVLFQLAIPVATHGKVEVYYNSQLAYTIRFDVVDAIQS